MKNTLLVIALLVFFSTAFGQTQNDLNLDFEKTDPERGIPESWYLAARAGTAEGYIMESDGSH